jgi:hypothetical protein
MKILSGLILLSALSIAPSFAEEPPPVPQGPRPTKTSCAACHSELDDTLMDQLAEDIHFQKGLSCHDCHGGDPTAGSDGDPFAAHDESKGSRGKPERVDVPEFCATCHSDANYMKRFDPHARVDQLSEYRTSRHGQKLAEGDDRVAVCVDCHGNHGIHAVSDPRSPV